ncbi:MAG: hypothetical protein U0931_40860 [Vulcanimicrobiota bacterium]
MSDPILPRHNRDRESLRRRLEQAAQAMRRDEARLRWSALGFALALGVLSGCAPTAVYGGPPLPSAFPTVTATGTPGLSPSPLPQPSEQPSAEVYGAPRPRRDPKHR